MEVVECHIEAKSANNIHDVDEDGFTALHHAARYNRVKVLELLVNAGGGMLNIQTSQPSTEPLHPRNRGRHAILIMVN